MTSLRDPRIGQVHSELRNPTPPQQERFAGMAKKQCPACKEICYLEPLKRAGGYRLLDPDGGNHTLVCAELRERQLRAVTNYHPHQPAAQRFNAESSRNASMPPVTVEVRKSA